MVMGRGWDGEGKVIEFRLAFEVIGIITSVVARYGLR